MKPYRYIVQSAREETVLGGLYPRTHRVVEFAKDAEEANTLYDLMLEDEDGVGPIEVIDKASGKVVRHSLDPNEKPL